MKIVLPKIPQRHHRALFDRDLPFRGRKEQRKDLYQRRPKHRAFMDCKAL
jgi:hypothetical protein